MAVTGCGGSDTAPSAQAWATGICTSIATWKADVEAIATNAAAAITEPGATRDNVETAIDDGLAATRTLIADLRALTPPDTPEGEQAKVEVEAFLGDAQSSIDAVESAIEAIPDDARLAKILAALSGLATNLEGTIASGRELVASLAELGGTLKDAFESADSCQELSKS